VIQKRQILITDFVGIQVKLTAGIDVVLSLVVTTTMNELFIMQIRQLCE
jgi:hypothetical protein